MRPRMLLIGIGLFQGALSANQPSKQASNTITVAQAATPSLDELAGEWQNVAEVYNHPSAEGFWGGVATTANLLSFTSGTFPPASQGGESAILTVNDREATASHARWSPYQVERSVAVDRVNLTSVLRMGFERNLVLLQLSAENTGANDSQLNLQIEFGSYWRYEPGTWQWSTPRPSDFQNFSAFTLNSTGVLVQDRASSSASAFRVSSALNFTKRNASLIVGSHTLRLKPKETWSLSIALAVANSSRTATTQSTEALSNFMVLWNETKERWTRRYEQVFERNNTFFSGSLPTLETADSAISKLWYQSVISILSTLRTNLIFPRVYATVGPDEGTTIVYAWDTSLWAGILTLLDPAFLKEQVSIFLQQGVHNGYAVDYLSMKLVGPWYSANDFSMFNTMLRYVNMTGDYAWLKQPAGNGSSNLAQLEALATYWEMLRDNNTGLADYGGLSNLLEEVPTYTNMVPSLNAANVYMMNQYANLLSTLKNTTGADAYRSRAADQAELVLDTYAGLGTGYWLTTYPNRTRQAVRHVYDFNVISLYMTEYLNTSVRADMASFFEHELYTGHWIRALSVVDLVANVSMRPDHGSNGAYTSWPALAAGGISQLGSYRSMIDYLRSFSSVLTESTWAQCYQLIDPLGPLAASGAEAAAQWAASVGDYSGRYFGGGNGTAPAGLETRARISLPNQGETFNENNGASFADVILTYVFGWNPDGTRPGLREMGAVRGDFRGSLTGIRGPDGKYYKIVSGARGISLTEV